MPISQDELDRQLAEADEVEVIDPEIVEPGKGLSTTDDTPLPWEHQSLEFYGDKLEVRKPTQQALAAFGLASGKYVPAEIQNNFVGLFVKRHLSDESFERVFVRLLDPDDTEYTPKTIGELMRAIATVDIDAKYKADIDSKVDA